MADGAAVRGLGATPVPANRAGFVQSVYLHLLAAVVALVALEVLLFGSGIADRIASLFASISWLVVLGGFMIVAWLASRAAWRARSATLQYLGLAGYVVAKAVILIPLLRRADAAAPGLIAAAAQVTLLGFGGLTAVAVLSRRDFSFLGVFLCWLGLMALGVIVIALTTELRLGAWFSIAMIALAGASVLHDSSKVLRRFPRSRPAGAALALFSSMALMFWYVLRLGLRGRS